MAKDVRLRGGDVGHLSFPANLSITTVGVYDCVSYVGNVRERKEARDEEVPP